MLVYIIREKWRLLSVGIGALVDLSFTTLIGLKVISGNTNHLFWAVVQNTMHHMEK